MNSSNLEVDLALRHEAERIRKKHPDKVPVIVVSVSDGPVLDKTKYLVPKCFTCGQLTHVFRKRSENTSPTAALFVLFDDRIPPASATVGELLKIHGDAQTGVLRCTVTHENVYGS